MQRFIKSILNCIFAKKIWTNFGPHFRNFTSEFKPKTRFMRCFYKFKRFPELIFWCSWASKIWCGHFWILRIHRRSQTKNSMKCAAFINSNVFLNSFFGALELQKFDAVTFEFWEFTGGRKPKMGPKMGIFIGASTLLLLFCWISSVLPW